MTWGLYLLEFVLLLFEAALEPVLYGTGRAVDALILRPLRAAIGAREVQGHAKAYEHHVKVGFVAWLVAGAVFCVVWVVV